jgi:hypothetical protein
MNVIESGIKMNPSTTKTFTMEVPAYVRDPDVPGGFMPFEKLVSDRDLALRSMKCEVSEFKASLDRVRDIAKALQLTSELKNILK